MCYGLDLQGPPKAHVVQSVALLGGGGTYWRPGLVEGSWIVGGMALEEGTLGP